MKKAACWIMAAVLCFSLFGCAKRVDDLFSDITEKTGIIREIGTYVANAVSDGDIKTVKPARESDIGRFANCYYALDDEQKNIYLYLLSAASSMPEGWFYCGDKTADFQKDISVAYNAVLGDNPQIFWLPVSYLITKSSSKTCVAFSIDDGEYTNEYILSKTERDEYSARLNRAAETVVSKAKELSDDYSKELFVHDYLCNNVAYNLDGGKMIYSSYGALVDGVCVCEGYSRAMQLCMQKLGINCGLVYGEFDGVGHMWNQVLVDDNWYNTDVTWDRSEKYGALHGYFNITDEEIKKDHIVSPLFISIEDYTQGTGYNILVRYCGATEKNYFTVGGRFLTDSAEQTADVIFREYESGARFAELKDIATAPADNTLNSAAYILRDKLTLRTYTKIREEVIVFFQNTY